MRDPSKLEVAARLPGHSSQPAATARICPSQDTGPSASWDPNRTAWAMPEADPANQE